MFTSEAERVMEEKFKTEHTQGAEKALMDMLTTDHAAATNGLKDAFYSYIENIFTEMTLKGTLDDLVMKNLKRWSHAQEFMEAFAQRVPDPRTFTNPPATFAKQLMNSTVTEWRLNAKEETHQTEAQPHPVEPPSL